MTHRLRPADGRRRLRRVQVAKTRAKFRELPGQGRACVDAGPEGGDAFPRHPRAQVRITLARDALLHPARAQTLVTVAGPATGEKHPVHVMARDKKIDE